MTSSPRVLLINGSFPPPYGGISTYLAHALPHLVSKGISVHTVMDKRPSDPQRYASFERAGIHITYGGGSRVSMVLRAMKHIPLWREYAAAADLPFHLLLRTIASLTRWVDAAEQVLRTHPIDIIHAYDYPWVQGFIASRLARKYGAKYVQTTFGELVPHRSELEQYDDLSASFKKIVTHILGTADAVIAMSEHCARELGTVGIHRDKVRVMYYGIDTNKYSPVNDGSAVRSLFGWGDRPIVLFLGHIRPRKGPHILLEAVQRIVEHEPNVLVVFVGPDYGMVGRLQERANDMNVGKHVVFLGPQPDEILVGLYAACDVFAFPTCTPIECLGLSMVQAMASGRPVVGSDINGIPEVIVEGETGYLVPPSDPGPLGEKIGYLLGQPNLRTKMGNKGRERACAIFDQDNVVGNLEDLYRELCD